MIGEVIGNHRVTARIGERDTGVVYRAEHTVIGGPVAIEFLHAELGRDGQLVDRFFEALRAVTALQHPGIVEIFDFGHHHGAAYVVMEHLDHETLDARIRRKGRIRAPRALAVVRQVAGVLADAHDAGVIHGALAPQAMVLVPDSAVPGGKRVKLRHFGVALLRSARGAAGDERAREPMYLAPELLDPALAPVTDHRVDLYALGCTLYQMLAGVPPFMARDRQALIARHLHDSPPSLYQFATDITPDIDALVRSLLARHPDARTATAAAVVDALDAIDAAASGSDGEAFPDEPVSVSFVSEPVSVAGGAGANGAADRPSPSPPGQGSADRPRDMERAPAWALPAAIALFCAIAALTWLILR